MQLKEFDKILFWILLGLVCSAFGLYYWSSRQSTVESTNKLKSLFYSTKIDDTIRRIEPIYKDNCSTSFWIANYPAGHVLVDLCKYPNLRSVEVGDVIRKDQNSADCLIIVKGGKQIRINLQIEY
jgi:hypothetical protein